jgi:poly-beta-1,6-N-acetyl-D-glucosamine synthase
MYWLAVIAVVPYSLILINIWLKLRKLRPFIPQKKSQVFISVVVACRNSETSLRQLLDELNSQDYPADSYEIIIVDDNSSDSTAGIAREYKTTAEKAVVTNNGSGKKQAVRTGIMKSKGELILTTDSDCIPGSSWISTIASFYSSNNNPGMIISPVNVVSENTITGITGQLEFFELQGITAGAALAGRPVMCNGANLAFRRDKYIEHADDLHDEINSGDDIFLLHSFRKDSAIKILWLGSEEAIVKTSTPSSASALLKQRSRWFSKSHAYTDTDTILLIISVVCAMVSQALLTAGLLVSLKTIPAFVAVLLIKMLPESLIAINTLDRYRRSGLKRWIIPFGIIYPFYAACVVIYQFTGKKDWISSPSQKGT